MLTPQEARRRVLERIPTPTEVLREPLARCAGRILAADAVSDVDLPPFEKSMMDGFAVRSSDLTAAGQTLTCVGESRAGEPFDGQVPAGSCIEIYTGAELPADCDAVEMVERTSRDDVRVTFERPVKQDQHVSHLGEILARGRAVFGPGRRLTPSDLSVLASIGLDPVPVFPRVRVSVLTTGDELVPPTTRPGRGQIREGNTLYLAAACELLGCEVRRAGIVRDDADELAAAFREALEEGDVLITTGGVSVGKYDLVGRAFEAIGVEPVLHKVAIKPGKPIWFGMHGQRPVFALPGNPVSCLICHEVFVRPALAKMESADPEEWRERLRLGRWEGPSPRPNPRQQNLPVRVTEDASGVLALTPLDWSSSADIVGLAAADGMAVVPPGETIERGAIIPFRPLR
jgi:molybdopterin molybdotransferase